MENKDDSVKSVVDLLTVNTIREKNCVHNVEEQVFVKNMGTEKINAGNAQMQQHIVFIKKISILA
jgi:hypothetical protein